MSREVRRVPASWEHPRDGAHFIPLHDNYNKRVAEWDEENAKWQEGLRSDWKGEWKSLEGNERGMTFAQWSGDRPRQEDYMPEWTDEEKTHYQMYETCTEGTPISPVMESPEILARWLADNKASAFADRTATYEQWLGMIDEGSSVSAVMTNGVLQSGVAAIGDKAFERNRNWPDTIV